MFPPDPLTSLWAPQFQHLLLTRTTPDAAHDLLHIHRVVTTAQRLTIAEGADWQIVLPAAWLHDCVSVPKSSPQRAQASRLAAEQALTWLSELGWPHGREAEIAHAIEAHSFSAGIPPTTLEAKVLQDADRLDALGAIGLTRVIQVSAELKRPLYHAEDPFFTTRQPDDSRYAIDHFPLKLLRLHTTMQTPAGKAEAQTRTTFLEAFLTQLQSELTTSN
jgi:uncharacterized protein